MLPLWRDLKTRMEERMIKTCDVCGKLDSEDDPIVKWRGIWACVNCHKKEGRIKVMALQPTGTIVEGFV